MALFKTLWFSKGAKPEANPSRIDLHGRIYEEAFWKGSGADFVRWELQPPASVLAMTVKTAANRAITLGSTASGPRSAGLWKSALRPMIDM